MNSLVEERMCTRGQEDRCERGREGVRLHRRLGVAPKAICISYRVFWNSSQSRLNTMAILWLVCQSLLILFFCPASLFPSVYPLHPKLLVSCFPMHNECQFDMLKLLGTSIDEHVPECGRILVADSVRVNSPNRSPIERERETEKERERPVLKINCRSDRNYCLL